MNPYSASYGTRFVNLTTVQRAWLDSDKNVIGTWGGTVRELPAGSGNYGIYEEPPADAYWLAWRTASSNGRYLVVSLRYNAYVFNYWSPNTGKSVGYTFVDKLGAAIGSEVTDGVTEFLNTGTFLATNAAQPAGAAWMTARTIEATPRRIVFSIDRQVASPLNVEPITHADDRVNILTSLMNHVKTHEFYVGPDLTTIADRYDDISFGLGFPDLKKLEPPHLAVALKDSRERASVTWERSEKPYNAFIYGFVGGLSGGLANDLQLQRLLDDVENVFDQANRPNVIDLLDLSSGTDTDRTVLDSLSISEVVGRTIEAGSDETLDVSRFRFTVTMTVGLWKSQ